ncbi:hypothetical protein ACIQXD_37185 [Streptomyces uncialis]|uniref:hypothetical protein n=1 Tax=Streptomyces uncialis TaxID=1048205 RepID=UPI003811DA6D
MDTIHDIADSTHTAGTAARFRQTDVRFPIHDYDFTNKLANGCSNEYRIRSVGPHKAGYVFGLGQVGSRHSNLTMYTRTCHLRDDRQARQGDVLPLHGVY